MYTEGHYNSNSSSSVILYKVLYIHNSYNAYSYATRIQLLYEVLTLYIFVLYIIMIVQTAK